MIIKRKSQSQGLQYLSLVSYLILLRWARRTQQAAGTTNPSHFSKPFFFSLFHRKYELLEEKNTHRRLQPKKIVTHTA